MRPTRRSNGRPMAFPKRPCELKRGRCSRMPRLRWRPTRCAIAPCSTLWPACASRPSAAGRAHARPFLAGLAGLRMEPILGRLRPVAPPPVDAEPIPPVEADPEPVTELADDNPFTPDELGAGPPPGAPR